jgi:hypothetical protein
MEIVNQQQRDLRISRKRVFLVKNLAVKIPDRKSDALRQGAESDLDQGLGKDALHQIDKDTKRLPPYGHGSFGDVLKRAQDLGKIWEAYQSDSKVKVRTGMFSTKKLGVTPDQLEIQARQLHKEAKAWADGQPEAGDPTRTAKQNACRDFMSLAKKCVMAAKMGKLDELQAQIDNKKGSPEVVSQFRELDAQILCLSDNCEVALAGGGSSDVRLIKGPTGEVAYAFKAVAGESTQMGSPKGGGALRECLASRLFEELDNKYGLDFNWPKTTLAKVPLGDGDLIDGLPGKPADEVDSTVIRDLPDEAKQKLLLASLATGQMDAKWGNAFVEGQGDDVKMRPSDGGAFGPSLDMLMIQVQGRGVTIGSPLTADNEKQPLESAGRELIPEICQVFKGLDVKHLENVMALELVRAKERGLDADELGVTDGCMTVLKSIGALKGILAAERDEPITFEGVIDEYNDWMSQDLAGQKQEWDQSILDRYLALKRKYGNLLPEPGERTSSDIFNDYLDPRQLERWEAIHALNQDVGLGAYLAKGGFTLPFPASGGYSKERIQKLASQFPADVKARHPGVFQAKK